MKFSNISEKKINNQNKKKELSPSVKRIINEKNINVESVDVSLRFGEAKRKQRRRGEERRRGRSTARAANADD